MEKFGIGTKVCPNCNTCICHGDTIQDRFNHKKERGDFIESNDPDFDLHCWTIRNE